MSERSVSLRVFGYEEVVLGAGSLCAVLGISRLLAALWHPTYAARWAVAAELIFITKVAFIRLMRRYCHSGAGEGHLVRLYFPDYVTTLRGFAVSCMGGFIFAPKPAGFLAWVPGILYLAGIAGDFLDGYLARKSRGPTRFGTILDNEFDSIATFLGVMLGIHYGGLPPWYFVTGLAHYLFLGAIMGREKRGLPVNPMQESNRRRLIGGGHSLFTAAALSPLFPPELVSPLSIMFILLVSGSFTSDWLAVTKQHPARVDN